MPKGRESGMPDPACWETYFNPACIVSKLDCRGGDVVEFGCGYGLFTVPAAQSVSGTVYALDIDPEMIATTTRRVVEAGLDNVVVDLRDFLAHGCGRPDESATHSMLYNILHVEEPGQLLREAFRILAPGGTVGIIHWKSDPATPRGPSLPIRPTPAQCRAWAEQVGFRFIRTEDLCCCSWHWGLLMERP